MYRGAYYLEVQRHLNRFPGGSMAIEWIICSLGDGLGVTDEDQQGLEQLPGNDLSFFVSFLRVHIRVSVAKTTGYTK